MDIVADGDGGRAGAVTEAVDWLQRKLFIAGGLVEIDAQSLDGMLFQGFAVHRLAGFGATDADGVLARRRDAKIVIKADDAVYLGLGLIERLGSWPRSVAR